MLQQYIVNIVIIAQQSLIRCYIYMVMCILASIESGRRMMLPGGYLRELEPRLPTTMSEQSMSFGKSTRTQ